VQLIQAALDARRSGPTRSDGERQIVPLIQAALDARRCGPTRSD
jgi:hypothetical protein